MEDFDAYICLPSGDLMAIYMGFHGIFIIGFNGYLYGIPWDFMGFHHDLASNQTWLAGEFPSF